MKHLILFQILLISLLIMPMNDCHAQHSQDVQNTMNQIAKKHEANEGISCMTVTKGSGLEMIKMMFNREFGKEFMKGVTSITFLDYSDASEQTCIVLRNDLDTFLSLLKEFDISNEKEFTDNDYIRCFASEIEPGTLSDFVIALENDKSKMILYMAGKIQVE